MIFSLFQPQPPAREKRMITLGGRLYSVAINRRQNARRMTLRIRDRGISLTMPYGISDSDVDHFIASHQSWIEDQVESQELALANALPGKGKIPMIYYQGRPTKVKLYRQPEYDRPSTIDYSNETLTIHMNAESRIRPVKVLENQLKKEARTAIKDHLRHYLDLLGEDPAPVAIRDQKTRWGSCSTTRQLSFNWRLVMAPPESLEYVVAHEAVHLIHHDHSRHFWGKLGEIMPDYRQHQQWLRDYQTVLFADLDRALSCLRPELKG